VDKLIEKYVESIKPSALGLTSPLKIQKITKLGLGEGNSNYLVKIDNQKFNFRFNLEKNTFGKSKKEYTILKAIESLKIAPKPFFYDPDIKNGLLVLEYIDGVAFPSDYHLSNRQFAILAKELAELHNLKSPENAQKNRLSYVGYQNRFKTSIRYLKKKFAKYGLNKKFVVLCQEVTNELSSEIIESGVKNKFSITHGDLAPQNIVKTKNGFRFIDWESAGIGDPAADLASVIDEIGFPMTSAQRKLFLKEYAKERSDKTIIKRMNLFVKLIRFAQVLWSINRVYEIKDRELGEELITEYLKKGNFEHVVEYLDYSINRLIEVDNHLSKKDFEKQNLFPKSFKI